MIVWEIRSGTCSEVWRAKVETQEHSLYPNQDPASLPIVEGREFTVSISEPECTVHNFEVNVTLTLLTTDNVFDNVNYISCEMSELHNMEWRHIRSTVYLVDQSAFTTTDVLNVFDTGTKSSTTSKCVKFESHFTLTLISAVLNIILYDIVYLCVLHD